MQISHNKRKQQKQTGASHALSFHRMSQVTKIAVIATVMATTSFPFYLRNSALTLFSPIMLLVAKGREASNKAHLIFNELHFGGEKVDTGGGGGTCTKQEDKLSALYFGCPVRGKQK